MDRVLHEPDHADERRRLVGMVVAVATSSPHLVLGVARNATPSEVKSQFRRLSFLTHPDKGGDPAAFRAVLDAYRQLRYSARTPMRRPGLYWPDIRNQDHPQQRRAA